jgi:hypothetical protein
MVGWTGSSASDRTRAVTYDPAEAALTWPSCMYLYTFSNNLGEHLTFLIPLDLLQDLIKQIFCLAGQMTPSGGVHGDGDLHCQHMSRAGELLMGIWSICIYSRKIA